MSAPKSCLDKNFKYDTAAQSREPNYLWNKFKPMLDKQKEIPNLKPTARAKLK